MTEYEALQNVRERQQTVNALISGMPVASLYGIISEGHGMWRLLNASHCDCAMCQEWSVTKNTTYGVVEECEACRGYDAFCLACEGRGVVVKTFKVKGPYER